MTELGVIVVKWSGNEYCISDLENTSTVMHLKELVHAKTGVLPKRQKLMGLKCNGIWLS